MTRLGWLTCITASVLVAAWPVACTSESDTGDSHTNTGAGATGGAEPDASADAPTGSCPGYCAAPAVAQCYGSEQACLAACAQKETEAAACPTELAAALACEQNTATVNCLDARPWVSACQQSYLALIDCTGRFGLPASCITVPAFCNPLTNAGCLPTQRCDYLTSDFRCRSGTGSAAEGDTCNTAADCQPGLACAMYYCATWCCSDADCGGSTCHFNWTFDTTVGFCSIPM
jgi:hypothetical protein